MKSSVKAKLAVLDEIIGLCDEAATGPFKKKEPEAILAIVEKGDEDEKSEAADDEMDTDELLEAYEAKKARDKEEA